MGIPIFVIPNQVRNLLISIRCKTHRSTRGDKIETFERTSYEKGFIVFRPLTGKLSENILQLYLQVFQGWRFKSFIPATGLMKSVFVILEDIHLY